MRFKSRLVTFAICLTSYAICAQTNLALLISQPGDYIGQGQTYVTTNEASISLSGSAATVTVGAFGFSMAFDAPGASNLTVGVYSNATRWPFNSSGPGLSISGNGRGCNTVCGDFRVYEISTNSSGVLQTFWATFTQRCECGTPQMTGEVRVRSQLAPAAPQPKTLRVPSEFATIQAAIDAASLLAVDTVLVAPGTYSESLVFKGKRVRVLSENGPGVTLIRPLSGPGVTFNSGETAEAMLGGFTITNGAGGISLANSASPTIVSNVIINCTGTAINCNFASPTVRSNHIAGSTGNAFYLGGAATPLIEGNIIENNGGGFDMFAAGDPTIRNNLIRDNRGNGMSMVNRSDANIVQNIIIRNNGHGITWLVPSGNRGPYVFNNTIVANSGSAINADGYDAGSQIINNILVGSPALSVGGFNDNNPPIVRFNNVFSPNGNAYSGLITNLTGVSGNISTNPLFTCEPTGDFRLLAGSPCIDRGSNGVPHLLATDFNGNSRIQDGDTNSSATIDFGALEFSPATAPEPCLFITCSSNLTVTAALGENSAFVNYPVPNATPVATVVSAPPSGSLFHSGTNLVTCTATYGTNSVSCTFFVTVLVRPFITNQPQNLTVSAGDVAIFSVGAQGTAPLGYQWSFEGANIVGATNATLAITSAQAANGGYYRVSVSNTLGVATSAPALLRVLPAAPSILTQPASQAVPAGTNVALTVAAKGSAPLFYQWFREASALTGATTSHYSISNVQSGHSGDYHVVISNSLGSVTSSFASLTINDSAPFFRVHPSGATLLAGTNLSLVSLAGGTDPVAYQWRHNGQPISGANNPNYSLSNITPANAGSYNVIASNAFGSATSQVATVVVTTAPQIIEGLTNQIVTAGSTVALAVVASGSGALAYNWQLNGIAVPGTNSSLTLTNVDSSHSGYYRVNVTSQYGSTSSVARVTVLGPPSFIIAWGDNLGGQTNAPAELDDIVSVAGGDFHSLALRKNGSLIAWGHNPDNQNQLPSGTNRFVGIATGAAHNLAITPDGNLMAWGKNDFGQLNVPASVKSVLSVAAGEGHSVALLSTGTVVAWGDNSFGQTNVPVLTAIRAIAAGRNHCLALRSNGTVSAWGHNGFGQTTVPSGLSSVKALAAGYLHSIALRSNGTVVVWGDNSFGQTNVPPGLTNVVAIAAGDLHTFALRGDGSLIGWGDNYYGQTNLPPAAENINAIASGYYHGLALAVPKLRSRMAQNQHLIEWHGPGVLQSATTLVGPYQDLPGISRAYTNSDFSSPTRFFRLRPAQP